ncbi:MAG: SMC-Scp complex subunit ScpB [Syntrophothermaceae bacterium]
MLLRQELKAAIEAVLFTRAEPIDIEELSRALGVSVQDTREILQELISEYNRSEHGIQVVESDAGYTMCTKPEYFRYVNNTNRSVTRRLSQAALETLAIVAYQQPVTRPEIEAIRGVRVEGVLNMLVDRGLVAEAGRKDVPGRPLLYVTTAEFLRIFGITSLDDLPRKDEEA